MVLPATTGSYDASKSNRTSSGNAGRGAGNSRIHCKCNCSASFSSEAAVRPASWRNWGQSAPKSSVPCNNPKITIASVAVRFMCLSPVLLIETELVRCSIRPTCLSLRGLLCRPRQSPPSGLRLLCFARNDTHHFIRYELLVGFQRLTCYRLDYILGWISRRIIAGSSFSDRIYRIYRDIVNHGFHGLRRCTICKTHPP